jgi:hypothetical protein
MNDHCQGVLRVLEDAGLGVADPDADEPAYATVALRPAMQILRLPLHMQHYVEDLLREKEGSSYCWRLFEAPPLGHVLCVSTLTLLQFLRWGRHPVCMAYVEWECNLFSALVRHGYYDPATQHTPPPGEELTALELREEGRDLLNGLIPGMGDAVAGQRPTTEEGRRTIAYLSMDEDGTATIIRDCDLPTEEDEDDEHLD